MVPGPPPPEHADPTFVGRAEELGRMRAMLAQASGQRPATLFISGEVGVGKTRLLAEFARQAQASGARVLRGSCFALGAVELPYAPLIDALRRLARDVGQERVRALAGPGYADLAGLTGLAGAEPNPPGGPGAQSRIFSAALHLLDQLGREAPVVFAVEDLQWADPSTLDLMGYLARVTADERLLLIGTYRTTDLSPHSPLRTLVAELDLARRIRQFEVPPFGRGELARFLRDALHTEAGHDLVERTLELSDGNALFAEQLLTTGVISVTGEDERPDRVSRSLGDLVLARFRSLGGDAREVMRVAATAGRRVSHRLLAAVCGLPERELLAGLRECVESQMLVNDPYDQTYAFRHALGRELVHVNLLPAERESLHRAIAVALAADSRLSYAGDLTVAAELSYHWHEARAFPEALVAAVRAGEQAARVLAFREAGQQYERAVTVWPDVADAATIAGMPKARLLIRAADAARWAGRTGRAVELARAAVAEADPVREPALAGEMHERLGSHLWEAGDRSASERAYAEAALLLEGAPASAVAARVLALRASRRVRQGHLGEGLEVGRSALVMASSVGARAEEGRALNWIGVAQALQGDVEDGLAALRESVRIADEVGDLEDLFRVYGNLAYVLEHVGQLEESVAVAMEALDRARQTGLDHTRSGGILANNMCAAMVQLGKWDDVTTAIGTLLPERALAANLFPRLTLAEVAVARGEFDTAEALLSTVRAEQGSEQPQFLGSMAASTAESAIWQGDHAAARAAIEDGLRAIRDTDQPVLLLRLCAIGLRNESDAGANRSLSAMDDLIGEAERLASREPAPALPEVPALLATCRAERDRSGTTGRAPGWAEVADIWERLHRPYRVAYARWRQAEAAAGAGSDVREAARQAYRLALELGAKPLCERLEALPARVRPDHVEAKPEDTFKLTPRERDVLGLICAGRTNREIAEALTIAPGTVGVFVSSILKKLDVSNRGAAAAKTNQLNLLGR